MIESGTVRKRGRPAQIIQVAELHSFVEFILTKKERSTLENQVIEALKKEQFNFDLLSEAQQILVKEALKPYRQHMKLTLLFDELSTKTQRSEYEEKFIKLYRRYVDDRLQKTELAILKTMCLRYLNFKAHKLDYHDLDVYLNQIQQKDAKKKRSKEDQRRYQLGDAVLMAFEKLHIDSSQDTPEDITNLIVNISRFHHQVGQSSIFKQVRQYEDNYFKSQRIFLEVLEGLNSWTQADEKISLIEINKALAKRNQSCE